MKRIVTGILAHVDAGKTTLSEGVLYTSGKLRKMGRVDNKNTYLDTNEIEKERGITIFSKQAVFSYNDVNVTLLDTPGHIDFSAETERTLNVLDYAILVVSGIDSIQSHTITLWNLLKKHNIPVFVFINKMDVLNTNKIQVINDLKKEFKENFIDFDEINYEEIATTNESLLEEFLNLGYCTNENISKYINERKIFPCFSGSALKMIGVKEFLDSFTNYVIQKNNYEAFGAKIFKINQDENNNRLTFLKVTGGSLKVKGTIESDGVIEKINEIRIYSGEKYINVDEVFPGEVCAVTGLKKTSAGQGLGFEQNSFELVSEHIFNYKVNVINSSDMNYVLDKLRVIESEETKLNVSWNSYLKEIQVSLMGDIQLEVLKQMIYKRFGLIIDFEEGRISYKETILNEVEGIGHYEPLRHYAEVHLLLKPLKRGSGLKFNTDCPEDLLDKNWQRLILTHLMEKEHKGVLTGSHITDMEITLKSGKNHLKHTEGGDFREATYRAVRQGLRSAKSILLEPYYSFIIELPIDNIGRCMTDLGLMNAEFELLPLNDSFNKIVGTVPVSKIRNYQKELISYTHGKGKITFRFKGYDVCKNQEEVIESINYNCDADVENTADSVFCSQGAGFIVKWDEVPKYMHLESIFKTKKENNEIKIVKKTNISSSDEDLKRIFENTYGKVEQKPKLKINNKVQEKLEEKNIKKEVQHHNKPHYLLVDGYNMIFAWKELKELAKDNLESARISLIEKMSIYKAFKKVEVIIVFDAYKVKGNKGEYEKLQDVNIVYTRESQTADAYIEKVTKDLIKDYYVTVATSDSVEQTIIFNTGALRLSALQLEQELYNIDIDVKNKIKENNLKNSSFNFYRMHDSELKK